MHVRHGADKLSKCPLDLVDRELPMLQQIVIQFVTCYQIALSTTSCKQISADQRTLAILQDKPDHGLGHNDLIKSGNVGMDELSVVVDLSCEIRVIFLGRLQDNLWEVGFLPSVATR